MEKSISSTMTNKDPVYSSFVYETCSHKEYTQTRLAE